MVEGSRLSMILWRMVDMKAVRIGFVAYMDVIMVDEEVGFVQALGLRESANVGFLDGNKDEV